MSAKYSIDQTTNTLVFTGKPKSVATYSFEGEDKKSFNGLIIPNSVSCIERYAFSYSRCLMSACIPNSVSMFERGVFRDCPSLASIHLPNSILTIDTEAFRECPSLASIHIPKSISNIGSCSLYKCQALASVYIPNTVSIVKDWAFYRCWRLHKACITNNSKINGSSWPSFEPQTSLLRPLLQPIFALQKKSACRASKATYSIYL